MEDLIKYSRRSINNGRVIAERAINVLSFYSNMLAFSRYVALCKYFGQQQTLREEEKSFRADGVSDKSSYVAASCIFSIFITSLIGNMDRKNQEINANDDRLNFLH